MKSGGKSRKGTAEKQEFLGEKLNKISKRRGQTTPVIPFWRLQLSQDSQHHKLPLLSTTTSIDQHSHRAGVKESPFQFPSISARKLAATFWELHQYKLPPFIMNQGVKGHPHGLRRLQNHHHHRLLEDNVDASPISPDMPESASSLRRQIALLMQHHRPIDRSNRAIQPVSPASYGSSLEVARYNPAVTPTSSTGFNGRTGDTSYNLKTSTELLKVLNRIWSLEEQHSSNILLVRGLKKELDQARSQIKELLRDQRADRQEIDELMRQIAEDKLAKKSKEQERINSAIQSAQDHLEDERKLRKRSESLHRKLARELNQVKMTHATALKEIETEKKTRVLLEDLCDEFAWGIRDYERELHGLRQKCNKDWAERTNEDRLILHVSESWLDVRAQMKLESQQTSGHSVSVADKLRDEIQAFIQVKRNGTKKNNDNLALADYECLKSFPGSTPLNVGVSAPQGDNNEEDSAGSDAHCFELQKPSGVGLIYSETKQMKNDCRETTKQSQTKKQVKSADRRRSGSPTSLQANFEEQMARALLHAEAISQPENVVEQGKASNLNPEETTERCDAREDVSVRRNRPNGTAGSNYDTIDSLIRSHYRSESVSMPTELNQELAYGGNSIFRNRVSPVRQWTEKLPSNEHEVSESSSKLPQDLKENTLKAKLAEARTRGQRSRSRLKGIKVPF